MKPWIHALSSARKYGGKAEDYLDLHNFMDSSKGAIPDNRHRALTHNSWFIAPGGPLERCFGTVITNSDGKDVSVRDLGEQHILEDFGGKFIPSAQDYLQEMEMKEWMNNGVVGVPPSHAKLESRMVRKTTRWDGAEPTVQTGEQAVFDGAAAIRELRSDPPPPMVDLLAYRHVASD